MSGLNFSKAVQASTLVFALGSAAAPSTFAATKTTNPYQVLVPKSFEYNTTGIIQSQAARSTISGPSQLSFSGIPSATYVTGSNQPIQLGQFVVNPATTANGSAAVTTYDHTPFVIQIHAPSFDKTSKVPILSSVLPNFGGALHLKTQTVNSLLVRGHLDGTVNGSSASSVTATVDSVKLGGLQGSSKTAAINYTFPVRYGDLKLPTSWTMNTLGNALATPAVNSTATATASTTTAGVTAASIGSSTTSSTTPNASAQLLATPAAEMLTANPLASPTPTPEPTSVLIFGAAIGGFAWSRRRRPTVG